MKEMNEKSFQTHKGYLNGLFMTDVFELCNPQERKVIFTMFEKWKEATRPTDINCNCVNDAMGRFDSIEYQQGQPGVEPINWEKFRHTCKKNGQTLHKDYGYVWNGDSMEWEPPHIQTCGAWQSGADCMCNEGEDGSWTILDQIESDAKIPYDIVYTHTKDGHDYSGDNTCCECPDVDLIAFKTKDDMLRCDNEEIVITATPLDFYNYIADTHPMTWIKWNLGNDNPLNQYVKYDTGHYNIHNEFVEAKK
jgi:hypothetical protein